MREPTLRKKGESRRLAGKERRDNRLVSAGVVASARVEDGKRGNTGSPAGAVHAATGTPRGAGRAGGGGGWARSTGDAGQCPPREGALSWERYGKEAGT